MFSLKYDFSALVLGACGRIILCCRGLSYTLLEPGQHAGPLPLGASNSPPQSPVTTTNQACLQTLPNISGEPTVLLLRTSDVGKTVKIVITMN